MPDVPEPLRDRPLLTLGAACIGSQEEGERIVAPLREIGEPIMDTFEQIPAAGLSRIHMDPEPPVPGLGHHALIAELPDEAIDAFVGAAGPEAGSPLLLAELRQLGGALGRPAENGGALSKLDAGFAMLGIGMPMTPELGRGDRRRASIGSTTRCSRGPATAATSTSPSVRATSRRSCRPRPAPAWPRSSGAGIPTG